MAGIRRRALIVLFAGLAAAPLRAASAADPEIIFRAVCGEVAGQRVDVDPTGRSHGETWKAESYDVNGAGGGTGTLSFVSDDAHTDQIRVIWGKSDQLLPIVYKNEGQISVADVDPYGVWIYTLFFRAGKVLISRQTNSVRFGAVGALLTANCDFTAK